MGPDKPQIVVDNSKPVPLSIMKIDPKVIKILKLDQFGIGRKERRLISKHTKVPWGIYQKLNREIKRRIYLNLNLETGEKIENEDKSSM
jgi:hypothetical protein